MMLKLHLDTVVDMAIENIDGLKVFFNVYVYVYLYCIYFVGYFCIRIILIASMYQNTILIRVDKYKYK